MDRETNAAVRQMILTGYRHHAYGQERELLDLYFKGKCDITKLLEGLSVNNAYNLGPQRLRALMNSTICLITVFCRAAIEYGANNEYSFALSDYYINRVEEVKHPGQLIELSIHIVENFRELAMRHTDGRYSPVVSRATRFINQNLYSVHRVSEVANHVRRSPNYFAALFKREVGMTPAAYIRKQKMEEAKTLLDDGYSVSETAEIFGYCDAAHFSNEFKRVFGRRPSDFLHTKGLSDCATGVMDT